MSIKQKLTEAAVDAFTDYLKERLELIKQLDLDKDGKRDIDQLAEIVVRCGYLVKEALDTTNFAEIAAGLEQITNGASSIGRSINKEKLSALGNELSQGLKTLGHLSKLSIAYVQDKGNQPF